MYATKITYKDFLGKERTEEFFFNLTKAEVIDTALSMPNQDWAGELMRIQLSGDVTAMMQEFERILLSSYGELQDEGRVFAKSEEISRKFKDHAAFDAMMDRFMTEPDYANQFLIKVFPQDLIQKIFDEENAGKPMSQEQLAALMEKRIAEAKNNV